MALNRRAKEVLSAPFVAEGVLAALVLIAFAPGGLETMAAMAVMMHVDATYVGAHHVIRLLFLSVFMPLLMRRNRERERATPSS